MSAQKSSSKFQTLCALALQLSKAIDADALLLVVENPMDWEQVKKLTGRRTLLVAGDTQ